jgi:hypothetical protein
MSPRPSGLLECKVRRERRAKKDVRFELNKLDCQAGKPIRMTFSEAKFEAKVAAFNIS